MKKTLSGFILGVWVLSSNAIGLQDGFGPTFTALEGLETSICDKFFQTWTALDEVSDALTAAQMGYEAAAMIDAKNVFTSLQELEESTGEYFEQTWTVIASIVSLLEDAGGASATDLSSFFTALKAVEQEVCPGFAALWNKAECLAATPVTGPTIISSAGSYCLTKNIQPAAGVNGITIAASNVTLDLNGKVINGPSGTSGVGICLAAGVDNVTIRNGSIIGFSRGIDTTATMFSGISKIIITDLCIKDCTLQGLVLDRLVNGIVQRVIFENNATGASATSVIEIQNSRQLKLKDIKVVGNGAASSSLTSVIFIASTRGVKLEDVVIANTLFDAGSSFTDAIRMQLVTDSILSGCFINDMFGITAGIRFLGVSGCLFKDCLIQDLVDDSGSLIGFDANTALASERNCFDACSVKNLTLDSPGICLGFRIFGDCNVLTDCNVMSLNHQGSSGFCSGFRLHSGSDRNDLIRCIVQCCEAVSTTTVAGFDIQDPDFNEFKDCQALNNSNVDDVCFSFGFLESNGSGSAITSSNIFIRNVALNNGNPCKIANQFFSFGGSEMASWVAEKASATSMIPTMTPFQSLAVKSN